jgi:hypothetical protein
MLQGCQLLPNKEDYENLENLYNQNFFNKFCHCQKSYEPETDMIKCQTCDDWYHFSHLVPNVPKDQQDEAIDLAMLVCSKCLKRDAKLWSELLRYHSFFTELSRDYLTLTPETPPSKRLKLNDSSTVQTARLSCSNPLPADLEDLATKPAPCDIFIKEDFVNALCQC